MWWPPDSDVVATTSLSGGHQIAMWWPVDTTSLSRGHHILTQEEQRIPHTSLSGGHQIISAGHQIAMWWPLHRYLVATTYYLVATKYKNIFCSGTSGAPYFYIIPHAGWNYGIVTPFL